MDRHIVITGASSGIGAALAREFLQHGARLTLLARREEAMAKLAADHAERVHIVACDLTDANSNLAWIDEAKDRLGPIDVLINNAGVQVVGHTHEVDALAGQRSLYLNLTYPLHLTQVLLPSMLDARAGHIVNIASMAALAPTPYMYYYNASKAGLAAASESLRGELRGSGVFVTTVYPGIIPVTEMAKHTTDLYRESRALDLQPTGTPERLAQLVYRATERNSARVIYPSINRISRHLPNATRFLMDRFTPRLRGGSRA